MTLRGIAIHVVISIDSGIHREEALEQIDMKLTCRRNENDNH